MSEKRFEMKGDTHIFDSKTSEEYYAPSEYELVDLLNSLAEENEKLKKENEELEISIQLFEDDVKRLQEENKDLKQQLDKIPPKIREVWLK